MSWHQAVLRNSEELLSAQMGGQVTYFMHIHWNNIIYVKMMNVSYHPIYLLQSIKDGY